MKSKKEDRGKLGIYAIRNKVNKKVYIGRSKSIGDRIHGHVTGLNAKSRKTHNTHFITDWHEYGRENFEYFILELIPEENNSKDYLNEREVFWMGIFRSTNLNFGYNLRKDSKDGMQTHEFTRKLMSEKLKIRNSDPKVREQVGKMFKEFWANNPDKLEGMLQKISKLTTHYYIDQYTKTDEFVARWETVRELLKANPTYKRHNIYSCCNGAKPSMYGFKWYKVLKDGMIQPKRNRKDG